MQTEMYKVDFRSGKALLQPHQWGLGCLSFCETGSFQPWFTPHLGCEQGRSHHPVSVCAGAHESFQHNFLILVFHKCLVINLQRWKIKTKQTNQSNPEQTVGKMKGRMRMWGPPKCSCLPPLTRIKALGKSCQSQHSVTCTQLLEPLPLASPTDMHCSFPFIKLFDHAMFDHLFHILFPCYGQSQITSRHKRMCVQKLQKWV